MLEYIILGFLMKKAMSGYAIHRKITVSTSNFYSASFGSIYPALKRLEKKGWISSRRPDSGEKKIEYVICDSAFLSYFSAGNAGTGLRRAIHLRKHLAQVL